MKLKDVLQQKPSVVPHETILLEGDVEPDTEGFFRLYPAPNNPHVYYVIPEAAVQGDVYQWTPEELRQARLVAQSRYSLRLRYDAPIRVVRVGYGLAGDLVKTSRRPFDDPPCAPGYFRCDCPGSSTCCPDTKGCGCDGPGDTAECFNTGFPPPPPGHRR